MKKRERTVPRYWQPLQRAYHAVTPPEVVAVVRKAYGLATDEEAIAKILEQDKDCQWWVNDLYQVEVRPYGKECVQLNIRRRDGMTDARDWRHFQQIKNELVGPECEAVELYPAESRKVDTSNKFHLWAITDPSFRFPIGFAERDVTYESGKAPGLKQRPL